MIFREELTMLWIFLAARRLAPTWTHKCSPNLERRARLLLVSQSHYISNSDTTCTNCLISTLFPYQQGSKLVPQLALVSVQKTTSQVGGDLHNNGGKTPFPICHMLSAYMHGFLVNQSTLSRSHCAWLSCASCLGLFTKTCAGSGGNSYFCLVTTWITSPWVSIGWEPSPTFYCLPNSSRTFFSNPMTSFQPFLPLELCHKTHIQGNDWLEAPTPFPLPSTSFQDIPFYN